MPSCTRFSIFSSTHFLKSTVCCSKVNLLACFLSEKCTAMKTVKSLAYSYPQCAGQGSFSTFILIIPSLENSLITIWVGAVKNVCNRLNSVNDGVELFCFFFKKRIWKFKWKISSQLLFLFTSVSRLGRRLMTKQFFFSQALNS